MNTLLWFQRDLRLNDNPALNWALQQGKPVIAIYIYSHEEDAMWTEGGASRWWLHQSLKRLSEDLLKLNIRLQFLKANSVTTITQLVKDNQVSSVVWTNRHEPHRIQYENRIENELQKNSIEVERIIDGLIRHPNSFLTASNNTPYRVFTPFYKKLRREMNFNDYHVGRKKNIKPMDHPTQQIKNTLTLDKLNLLDDHSWHEKLHNYWKPGEQSAGEKLDTFINDALINYQTERDIPEIDGTSSLSPHLHFGEISVQQIITQLAFLIEIQGGNIIQPAEVFLRQLVWREFARYTLWHFPGTSTQSMNSKFTDKFWNTDKVNFNKWKSGETGIPIIDAGMKQLWETGIMHNRVRMLVASLLTKNMGISWQQGASWFWDTLIDADLANNTMGWQWVAGCGVDAAPYYRIFNPETQAKKFDKHSRYINHWLDNTSTMKPSDAIVDLATSRVSALERYNDVIRQAKAN